MQIYIASSWKNQHAVEMLTEKLREAGHVVISFVEKADRNTDKEQAGMPFDEWVRSKRGQEKFAYDIEGATKSDMVIYIGPSGTDAWAEVGAAYGSNVPIFGLWAKGEQSGLMRLMVDAWHTDYKELLISVDVYSQVRAQLQANKK